MPDGALSEIGGAPFHGPHRFGCRPARIGGRSRRLKRGSQISTRAQRIEGREPGVEHRLVSGLGPASLHNAADAGLDRGHQGVQIETTTACGHGGHAQEECAVQGTRRTADPRNEGHRDLLQDDLRGVGDRVQDLDGGRQAPLHIDTVVGVADGGIQPGEFVGVFGHELITAADPGRQVCRIQLSRCHARRVRRACCVHRVQSPQHRPGVRTGASHRRRTSWSVRTRVKEQPAISRLVT